jgi:hypothetical protein
METHIKEHNKRMVVTLFKRIFVTCFIVTIGVLLVINNTIYVISSEVSKFSIIGIFEIIALSVWFFAWLLWNAWYLADPEKVENIDAWINPTISMFTLSFWFGMLFLLSDIRNIMFINTNMKVFTLSICIYNLIIFIFAVKREFKKARIRRFEDLSM